MKWRITILEADPAHAARVLAGYGHDDPERPGVWVCWMSRAQVERLKKIVSVFAVEVQS